MANALAADESDEATDAEGGILGETSITTELSRISPELDARWRGAVFALKPENPDATRHFSTSAREILTRILEISAPDQTVIGAMPNCDRTQRGTPTRRAKISFLLRKEGQSDPVLEEFVQKDIDDILELFPILNEGTHGVAGRFPLHELTAVKKRVEDGILFLARIAG